MEIGKWPEFKLFDPVERIKGVARAVGRFLLPSEPPLSQSDHYHPEHFNDRGAEAMLSRLQEPTDGEAIELRPDAKYYVELAQQAKDLKKQEE